MAGVVSRWFPTQERARAQGYIWGASRAGGALAPLLVVPIQAAFGWRVSFWILGAAGIGWCIVWWWWFRDNPSEKTGISAAELTEIGATAGSNTRCALELVVAQQATPDDRHDVRLLCMGLVVLFLVAAYMAGARPRLSLRSNGHLFGFAVHRRSRGQRSWWLRQRRSSAAVRRWTRPQAGGNRVPLLGALLLIATALTNGKLLPSYC